MDIFQINVLILYVLLTVHLDIIV